MATTAYFEETISDKKEKSAKIDLEFGRSSFYGENLMYITVEGKTVILDEKSGREIYDSMRKLGVYLGYDKDWE
jgi:hypothetical protein